jgi:hypothetical protein
MKKTKAYNLLLFMCPLLQEGLQRKEERRAQLQDWNVECQNFESRRQIGKFKKRNAEERGVYSRGQ